MPSWAAVSVLIRSQSWSPPKLAPGTLRATRTLSWPKRYRFGAVPPRVKEPLIWLSTTRSVTPSPSRSSASVMTTLVVEPSSSMETEPRRLWPITEMVTFVPATFR